MEKNSKLHANHRQRLKNRALVEGLDNFEPHNVMELMLFYALPHVDTNDIAHELINRFGSFEAVFNAPMEELVKIKGIKGQAATFLKLMPQFCRYYYTHRGENFNTKPTYEEIPEIFAHHFVGRCDEVVACMFFDQAGYYINSKVMFEGSVNSVAFSLRAVVDEAVFCGAYKIAIAHNHPSGFPIPTPTDIDTAKSLKVSFEQMNIEFIESYVIANKSYCGVLGFVQNNLDSESTVKPLKLNL